MNDRFKFRVWDKQDGCYAYSNNSDVGVLCIETDGELTYSVYNNDYEDMTYIPESEVIPEQCTGLKDKNGKLIYDGDYIRAINQDTKDRPDLQFGHIWVDELNCRWVKFDKEELSWNDFCSLIDYDLTLEIEVIGNEHQGLGIKEIVDD